MVLCSHLWHGDTTKAGSSSSNSAHVSPVGADNCFLSPLICSYRIMGSIIPIPDDVLILTRLSWQKAAI